MDGSIALSNLLLGHTDLCNHRAESTEQCSTEQSRIKLELDLDLGLEIKLLLNVSKSLHSDALECPERF